MEEVIIDYSSYQNILDHSEIIGMGQVDPFIEEFYFLAEETVNTNITITISADVYLVENIYSGVNNNWEYKDRKIDTITNISGIILAGESIGDKYLTYTSTDYNNNLTAIAFKLKNIKAEISPVKYRNQVYIWNN